MAIYKEAPFTKVTQLTNSSVAKLVASKGAGKELKQYVNNAAALADWLVPGDLYIHTGTPLEGFLAVVIKV